MNKRNLLIGAVLIVIILVGVASYYFWGGGNPTSASVSRFTRQGVWPLHIDPCVYAGDYNSEIAMYSLYDPLVYLDRTTLEMRPFLATSWDVSNDSLVYTLHLRNDVKFHDGTTMTADDVKFSVDRLLTMGQGMAFILLPLVNRTEVVDTYTIRFHLNSAVSYFLQAVFWTVFVTNKDLVMSHIVTPGQFGDLGDYGQAWLLANDAGSGPYSVKNFTIESLLVEAKFNDYWMETVEGPYGKSNPDRPKEIWVQRIDTEVTERQMLQSRDLELTSQFQSKEFFDAVAQINGVKVVTITGGPGMMYGPACITFNMIRPPVDDVHIRSAFAWAFNYTEFALNLAPGYGTTEEKANWTSRTVHGLASAAVPGALVAGVNMFPDYSQNMTKAVEELKQSPYFNNISQYTIDVDWTAEVPDREKMALLFAANVNALADAANTTINIKINKVAWLQCQEKWSKNDTSPAATVWGVIWDMYYGDIGGTLEYFTSKAFGNYLAHYWYYNKTYDDLYFDALATLNRTERFAKYAVLQNYLWGQVPVIIMGSEVQAVAYQKAYVDWFAVDQGVMPVTAGTMLDFRYIGIHPDKRQTLLTSAMFMPMQISDLVKRIQKPKKVSG